MSRQLNGAACTANSRQLLIGLDGLAILTKNATHQAPAVCTDDIGGAAHSFSPAFRRSSSPAPRTRSAPASARRATPPGSSASRAARSALHGGSGLLARRNVHVRQRHRHQRGRRLAGRAPPDLRRHEPHHRGDADPQRDRAQRGRHGDLLHQRRRRDAHTACATRRASTAPTRCAACCCRRTAQIDPHPAVHVFDAGVREDQARVPPRRPVGHDGRLPGDRRAGRAACLHDAAKHAGGTFAPEIADFASTANPFCNAGTATHEQGLLGRPRPRPVPPGLHHRSGARSSRSRIGVPGGRGTPNNSDVGCYATGVTPANYPQRERSSPQGVACCPGGSVDTRSTPFQTAYLARDAAALPRRRPGDLDPAGPDGPDGVGDQPLPAGRRLHAGQIAAA